jgi:hypothetical protein
LRALKAAATLAAALLTAALGWLWLVRRAMPYNEEGQYFDAASGVSYSDGAVTVFAAAALLAGITTAVLALWAWRR